MIPTAKNQTQKDRQTVNNRRRFERYETAAETRYTKVDGPVTIESSTIIKNIGLGGLCVTLSRIVRRKDILLVVLTPSKDKELAALTRVVWSKPVEADNNGLICGLKFLWISSKPLLNEYVESIGVARKTPDIP